MSVATFITFFRLFLALFSFYAAVKNNIYLQVAAVFIYILAAVLDVVDGYIARKFKIETAFGKILDPIADKIQTLPPFIFFALFGLYSIWWVVPIVIREVAISLIRFKMASQGVVLASERSGKIKTLSQHIAIVASYLFYLGYTPAFEVGVGNHFWYVLRFDAYFFLAAAVVLTVFSGLSFLKNNYMVIFSRA